MFIIALFLSTKRLKQTKYSSVDEQNMEYYWALKQRKLCDIEESWGYFPKWNKLDRKNTNIVWLLCIRYLEVIKFTETKVKMVDFGKMGRRMLSKVFWICKRKMLCTSFSTAI